MGSKFRERPNLPNTSYWNVLLNILFNSVGENREAVSPNCQRIMERFHDITTNLAEELLQGNICVGDLRMMISRQKRFRKVVAAIKDLKSDDISIALNGRHLELQAFENLYQTVQEFTKLCTKCKGNKKKKRAIQY